MMLILLSTVAHIGFVQEMWTVSEDFGDLVLLVESDGLNVEPETVVYSAQNRAGRAQGCPSYNQQYNKIDYDIFISLSLPPSLPSWF